ncbi:metal ABC transporter solute-binding protein, Zn/Mn family [Acidocella sp.]|uniref:metal ABC transporter solute-binding protein, Zn/Mn family n=1 Tax=Acidocella sp. TaxID=50710 RepID=UPI00263466DD|nr:zinc ABC transporter substrate-binding protein [Acidocella sp.]
MRFGLLGLALAALCGAGLPAMAATLRVVGIEAQYANVAAQIGGPYVSVSAVEASPDTDPHEFEVSPQVAGMLTGADIVVENGLGYEGWADQLLAGSGVEVISAAAAMGVPATTANPHLWYDPACMPAVAKALAAAYAAKDPAHAAYYQARLAAFDASLKPWLALIGQIRAEFGGMKVAVTEPVADDLLTAAGLKIVTPWSLQAAIMNGTDPAPQDVDAQNQLIAAGAVQLLAYNQQVTDPLTEHFQALAKNSNVRLLAVFEIMPRGVKSYQDWMMGETNALAQALAASGQ